MKILLPLVFLLTAFQAGGIAQTLTILEPLEYRPALIPFPARWEYLKGTFRPQDAEEIQFISDSTVSHPEGYRLHIREGGARVHYREPVGAFYARQTLNQLVAPDGSYPCLDIEDWPRFPYRGMHLDVGRHFFPVDFIKKYIDLLSRHKMNYFHWHLTEDQGWRIEIKRYPRLQEVAAWRKETLVGHYSDQPHQFDGKSYGGFYTQEEIREVVAYAQEHFVTIIPEIEMPGHAQALLAAYPELSCHGRPVEVATKWGVFENVLCPTEETFTFLENVLTEVMDLFPGPYIHIGGDECPKVQWEESAFCQELMQKEGLKDENELQSYFIRRIDHFLTAHRRKLIGWDEILEGGLSENATVLSWRGTEGGIAAARAGHDVIMSPTSHCYFDYYQSRHPGEPLAIGGYLPLEKVYNFDPIPHELTPEEARHILGAQGNVWTEYMPSTEQVEYMAFPRVLAMAEVVWSPVSRREYFTERLARYLPRLDVNYADHLFDIQFVIQRNELHLSNLENLDMWYQTEGQPPARYESPIRIDRDIRLKVWKASEDGAPKGRELELDFHAHAALGKHTTWKEPPHPNYGLGSAASITNGLLGSDDRYGDGEWKGWWGKDVELTVDLGENKPISASRLRFFQSQGQWIYLPREVEVWFSEDGKQYDQLARKILPQDYPNLVFTLDLEFPGTQARYWKIKVKRYGLIPSGAQGAGHEAWVFMDEWLLR